MSNQGIKIIYMGDMTEEERADMNRIHNVKEDDQALVQAAAGPNIGAHAVAVELLNAGYRAVLEKAVESGIVGTVLYCMGRDAGRDPDKLAAAIEATLPGGTA